MGQAFNLPFIPLFRRVGNLLRGILQRDPVNRPTSTAIQRSRFHKNLKLHRFAFFFIAFNKTSQSQKALVQLLLEQTQLVLLADAIDLLVQFRHLFGDFGVTLIERCQFFGRHIRQ